MEDGLLFAPNLLDDEMHIADMAALKSEDVDDFLPVQREFFSRDRAYSWDISREDQIHNDLLSQEYMRHTSLMLSASMNNSILPHHPSQQPHYPGISLQSMPPPMMAPLPLAPPQQLPPTQPPVQTTQAKSTTQNKSKPPVTPATAAKKKATPPSKPPPKPTDKVEIKQELKSVSSTQKENSNSNAPNMQKTYTNPPKPNVPKLAPSSTSHSNNSNQSTGKLTTPITIKEESLYPKLSKVPEVVAYIPPPLGFQVPVSSDGKIGAYTKEQRQQVLERYKQKKMRRVWRKQIKYDCRKRLADTRPRVKGRFVSRKRLREDGGEDHDDTLEGECHEGHEYYGEASEDSN